MKFHYDSASLEAMGLSGCRQLDIALEDLKQVFAVSKFWGPVKMYSFHKLRSSRCYEYVQMQEELFDISKKDLSSRGFLVGFFAVSVSLWRIEMHILEDATLAPLGKVRKYQ